MPKQTPFPGFVGSAFGAQSPNVDVQDLVNEYLQNSESPAAKKPNVLLPCPGVDPWALLPTSPVRGLFAQNDRFFAIGGNALYELTRTGDVIARTMTALATPSAPTITNSPLTPALDTPNAPTIAVGGALGSTTYGYKITATNSLGETAASTETTTPYGNATLSSLNYNLVSWSAISGANGYKVYRTTGPGAGVLVGIVTSGQLFYQDVGSAGTAATPPVANTSGGVAGATTYGYKIVATIGLGYTAASAEGVTLTGHATLDTDNYNIVTWPAVPNAGGYQVYRTTGGTAPPVLLGTTTDVTYRDVGAAGDSATPPITNTTGTDTITDDGAPAFFCSSGDAGEQIMIVSGGAAFVFDLTENTLAKVVDGATAGGYIASYFVVLDAATSTLKCSESLDGFSWDPLQAYQRLVAGDRWLGLGVTANELWLFGTNTADVWAPTGNNDTRFAPFNNVQVGQGVVAPASVDFGLSQTFLWLAQNVQGGGIVCRSSAALGYQPVQISTRGIETAMESYDTIADAIGWSYTIEGHPFYVLTFPTAQATWVYDDLTKEWHRRGYWDPDAGEFSAYRAVCHAFAFSGLNFGQHFVGDSESGVIGVLNPNTQTDFDGTLIRRMRVCPHASANGLVMTNWALVIDLDVGVGQTIGQGSDPTFMLQVSKDGGQTYGKELWRRIGKIGEFGTRVKFGRLGAGRDTVYKFVMTDPAPLRIAGAYWEPEVGTS